MDKRLFTIGFTGKNAEKFFGLIASEGVRKVIDVRLKNVSQLAGFTKRDDLRFFLDRVCGCGYEHRPEWAPTEEVMNDYKKKKSSWDEFRARFTSLLDQRLDGADLAVEDLEGACLLCSEPTADRCHRGLLAERFQAMFPGLEVRHL